MKITCKKEDYLKPLNHCKEMLQLFGVDIDIQKIRSKSREMDLVFQRALITYILRTERVSTTRIGSYLNRDHSTILNLTKYKTKNAGRDNRYTMIVKNLKKMILEKNLKKKIEYHKKELDKAIEQLNKII